jgi:hypothetical protein
VAGGREHDQVRYDDIPLDCRCPRHGNGFGGPDQFSVVVAGISVAAVCAKGKSGDPAAGILVAGIASTSGYLMV